MKYYIISYSSQIRFSGERVFFSKAIDIDPVDYLISIKEDENKKKMSHYTGFVLNFFNEISREQYLKLADN